MTAPSQDLSSDSSGRVNQKRRTRAAIVAAARAIVDRGETPTIAQVAEEALMTRTTVYRYFPTQESLLLEVSVTVSVAEIEELLARPLDGATPQDRLLEIIEVFSRHIAANEALYRTALRHYMDQWLAAERAGDVHERQFREGRRHLWISSVLAPLRDEMPDAHRRRLEAALCLVIGGEAFTVLRDVCRLDADQAIGVARWAAQALIAAALDEQRG
jgi:AcrR family transcriptional regulator